MISKISSEMTNQELLEELHEIIIGGIRNDCDGHDEDVFALHEIYERYTLQLDVIEMMAQKINELDVDFFCDNCHTDICDGRENASNDCVKRYFYKKAKGGIEFNEHII